MKNPTPPTGTSTFNEARTVGRFHAARDLKFTSRALVKAGHAWASMARLAAVLGFSDEYFRQLCTDGDPAVADGDVEALGPRFAIPYYERRLARMRAMLPASSRDLRDLAEIATEHCTSLTKGVREAARDGKYTAEELDAVDAVAMAAEAEVAAVRAQTARMRAALRDGGER